MKNIKILLLVLIALFLTSCDPIHRIDFINNLDSNTTIKIVLNSNIKNSYLDELRKGDSIILDLKSNGNKENKAEIPFARGFLSDYRINEISKSIKSIEIENKEAKIIYKSPNEIKDLLFENQKGVFFKTSITIKIDDDLLISNTSVLQKH